MAFFHYRVELNFENSVNFGLAAVDFVYFTIWLFTQRKLSSKKEL